MSSEIIINRKTAIRPPRHKDTKAGYQPFTQQGTPTAHRDKMVENSAFARSGNGRKAEFQNEPRSAPPWLDVFALTISTTGHGMNPCAKQKGRPWLAALGFECFL